jgi:glucokinase
LEKIVVMDKSFLGIEIGGTKLQIFLCDENGNLTYKIKEDVGYTKEASKILALIERIIRTDILTTNDQILAVGIGFGGPIDIKSGSIYNSYQVNGWDDFELSRWINKIINAPVYIENDANLAALAEACKGAGKDYEGVFYVTIGSGVGGGFILNKKIFHGHGKGESEIGHIRLNKSGLTFENACSGWVMDKKIRETKQQYPESKIAKIIKGQNGPEAKYLISAIQEDCEVAKGIFSELTDDIAFALSHVIHLLNPDTIIIGGGLSLMGEILVQEIRIKIPNYIMDILRPGPTICLSELKEDVVAIGALLLAMEKYKS